MLKIKAKSASKTRRSCNSSEKTAPPCLAGCSTYYNYEAHHKLSDTSCGNTEQQPCTIAQPRGVQQPTNNIMYVMNKQANMQVNDMSKMEAGGTSGQKPFLRGDDVCQKDSVVPLGVIRVEPMYNQQESVEQSYVQFDRNEVIDDMGISETVEVELPYLYPGGESQDGCEKLSVNIQYEDTADSGVMIPQNVAVVPQNDDDTCRSNVVVEKIMYEMPLIKAEAAGGSADFEGDKLSAVVYPQDSVVQWSGQVDDDTSDCVLHRRGEQSVEKTSSGGRFATEKHRTITIKDVTNCGRKKAVSPLQDRRKVVSSRPVTASALADTIIIVTPKSQVMTPLQVQHPTITQLLGPFASSMPAPTVCVFEHTHGPTPTPCSPPYLPPNEPVVVNVPTESQPEEDLPLSGSHPAVGDHVIIESHTLTESLHADDGVTRCDTVWSQQEEIPKVEQEEVVCSPVKRHTAVIMATPTTTTTTTTGGCHTVLTMSATDLTVVPKTSKPEDQVTSAGNALNPDTNKALKMLLSKVSHEQQREINVVGLVADSCNGLGKQSETLADRYMKNWKQTGQFQCKFCPYSSVTRNYLYRHWTANHISVTPYQCHHCDLKASSRDVITRHQTVTHQSAVKSVLIDPILEQQTIDQFDLIFTEPFGRETQAVDQGAVSDVVDAKKVKMENDECSDGPLAGVAQSDGFCHVPVVEVRIVADSDGQQMSVVCDALPSVTSPSCVDCDTRTVKTECQVSPAVTLQHTSCPLNTGHGPVDTGHTNVVNCELLDISTNVIDVPQDTHVDPTSGDTDGDKITDVAPEQRSSTLAPKPEQLQEQMMAALHSRSHV